jgi:alanyl-tRNA synthetase
VTSRELRRGFLAFFEMRGHQVVPSSSLVPADDPTLLFTNAGMNQFKDVFVGKDRRPYRRAATSQKCMRVSGKHNDLDNVGPSLRHHTFFEMLGNFSFGDYFKDDAIAFAWELLATVWQLPPERLYVTIFAGEGSVPRDDDAHRLWQRFVPPARIVELGLADNFWAMGETGPCGRCSEIHYFRGEDRPCPESPCRGVGCSCDRFVEIWNNVFMEFDRQADGTLAALPAPSIDTGMGLERIAAVMQGTLSNYETDLFQPLLRAVSERTGRRYGSDPDADVAMRVVADHVRATTFLVADGVTPSNEWRGYVLRKIMRRAMRHGHRLGVNEPFLHRLVDVVVGEMGDAYPELQRNRDVVVEVVRNEEERFDAVLTGGLARLEEVIERVRMAGRTVPGEEAFRLYDSLGLPLDYIEDLAGERGLTVDRAGFDRAMEAQRERARAKSAFEATKKAVFEADADRAALLQQAGDPFDGYTSTTSPGRLVLALWDETQHAVPELRTGERGYVALDRTPFYLEAGGQVSDEGRLFSDSSGAAAAVTGAVKARPDWPRLHLVQVTSGSLRLRDIVTAEVDRARRDATRRNHTATHLLHAALRSVLGAHVKQAGSLVAPDRLRFDFVHFAALTPDQLDVVERLVNEQVYRNVDVSTEVRATEEAMAAGAMALFGEKYGDRVRVVSIPGFSLELCGGTHCRATGDIGPFVVTQETGVAAGVRRIEAFTGDRAVARIQEQRERLEAIRAALGTSADRTVGVIDALQTELKRLHKENHALRLKGALGSDRTPADEATEVAGVKLLTQRVSGLDRAALRELSDTLKDRLGRGVVVIASAQDGKVALVVSVTKDLTDRLNAGRIVKEIAPIVGGGGGGRGDFAEAGGTDPSRLDEMLEASRAVVERMLTSS